MNTDYEIQSESRPDWKPHCVEDDSEKVYIHFPARALQNPMPILFIADESGRVLAAEYRLEGTIGVVNRLFDSAELKTFGHRGCTVRIRARVPRCRHDDRLSDLAA